MLAAYVLWSATVRPLGFVTRETVLMSKHWMDKVWSWDHCFNALALAPSHPELAIDQFLVVFDHQVATGALKTCPRLGLLSTLWLAPASPLSVKSNGARARR